MHSRSGYIACTLAIQMCHLDEVEGGTGQLCRVSVIETHRQVDHLSISIPHKKKTLLNSNRNSHQASLAESCVLWWPNPGCMKPSPGLGQSSERVGHACTLRPALVAAVVMLVVVMMRRSTMRASTTILATTITGFRRVTTLLVLVLHLAAKECAG